MGIKLSKSSIFSCQNCFYCKDTAYCSASDFEYDACNVEEGLIYTKDVTGGDAERLVDEA